MKTVLGIFARDLKALFKNPIAALVVGALLVLPGLYAWYCIIANWDPYANTGNVPIAIVNSDKGATSDLTGELDIGKQVVEKLEDNDNIDWRFYDEKDKALEDVRYGVCYAAIVLPEDLSANIAGIFEGSESPPTIYYYPNEKHSAVATKVCDSAAQTLIRGINQQFTSTVNGTLLEKVQDVAEEAEKKADSVHRSALTEIEEAQQDIASVVTALDEIETSMSNWRDVVANSQDTLGVVSDRLPDIESSLDDGSGKLDSLRTKSDEFSGVFTQALIDSGISMSKLSGNVSSGLGTASADIGKVSGALNGIIVQLESINDDLITSEELENVRNQIDDTLEKLRMANERIEAAADKANTTVKSVNGSVEDMSDRVGESARSFTSSVMPQLSQGTGSLATSLSDLSGAVRQFEPQVTELIDVLSQTDAALERAGTSTENAKQLLRDVSKNLDSTVTDMGSIGSALQIDRLSELLDIDPGNLKEFVSSPVQMTTEKIYPVSNYGTAVAPFYTNLALWVGCFILVSLIKLEVDRTDFEEASPTQRYFGRWLLFAILSLLQSQVICGVDILLGIDCANPALFMLAGAVCSFAYMNLIYALVISFRNIGKTLCILLLIMQVPGSSGMYPIEMMPAFFQTIHPALPFTYGIDAMRESLCGMYGLNYVKDLAILAILVPLSLLLGLGLRPLLINLMCMFDEEMRKTGFFASEEHGVQRDVTRLRKFVMTFMHSDNFRDEFEERAWRFNRRYPRLKRVGSVFALALPFIFLLLMAPSNLLLDLDVDAKLRLLYAMIVILLIVAFALILLEYMYRAIKEETRLLGLEIIGASPDGELSLAEMMMAQAEADDGAAGDGVVDGEAADGEVAGDEAAAGEVVACNSAREDEREDRCAVIDAVTHEAVACAGEGGDGDAIGDAGDSAVGGACDDAPGDAGDEAVGNADDDAVGDEVIAEKVTDAVSSSDAAGHAPAGPSPKARRKRRRSGVVRDIFTTDMRLGLQSVIGVIVIVLLVVTPSLYAWFNIAGSWNPYGNTGGLKVGVANVDEGYKGELMPLKINVGDTLVSQLRGNDSFDWEFVDEDEAIRAVESGEYYAAIVIPKGFSKSMMTYLLDDADYPTVAYYTNEKENPIAPIITQKGADSIQESIRAAFSQHVDEAGLTIAYDLMRYITNPSVSDYAVTMSGHLDDATNDMDRSGSDLKSLSDLTATVSSIVQTAGATLKGVRESGDAAKDAIATAEDGVASASEAFETASSLVEGSLTESSGSLDGLQADVDEALTALEEGAADAPDLLSRAATKVSEWLDVVQDVRDTIASVDPDGAKRLDPAIKALDTLASSLDRAADNASGASDSVAQARAELSNLADETASEIETARSFYEENVKSSVDDLKSNLRTVSDSAHAISDDVESTVESLEGSSDSLSTQLTTLSGDLLKAGDKLASISENVQDAKRRLSEALKSGSVEQVKNVLFGNDVAKMSERLANPIDEARDPIYPVANFGSSMAPFYTVLSLWVGALVMISTMRVRVVEERLEELRRRYTKVRPRHEFFGRYGIFSFISFLQSALVLLGDLLFWQIQCVDPVLFFLAGLFIGQVFCLIVYTFTELFGDVGKALCVILLIMQVAASGGTFPAEMLDPLLHGLVPYLPFYHAMSLLQECVAGVYMPSVISNAGNLLATVVIMLLVGVVVRKPFRIVSDFLEAQLEKTGYM